MVDAASTHDTFQLALETSSDIGGVAIGRSGTMLEMQCLTAPKKHAAELLPTIEGLCRRHGACPGDLAEVFVSVGPGSFTGLRIGVSAARALALAVDARTIGIGTLDVLAQNALAIPDPPECLVAMLDAGRGHVYASLFRLIDDRYISETTPVEADPVEYMAGRPRGCGVLGTGFAALRNATRAPALRVLDESLGEPRAQTVFSLGVERARRCAFDDPKTIVPHYIRVPYAEEKWKQKTRPTR